MLNHNRLAYIKELLNNDLKPDYIGFLVMDDTINEKNIRTKSMEALDFHYSHSLGKAYWSHCVITSYFVAGPYSIALQFNPYYRESKCKELGIPFQSISIIKTQLPKILLNISIYQVRQNLPLKSIYNLLKLPA